MRKICFTLSYFKIQFIVLLVLVTSLFCLYSSQARKEMPFVDRLWELVDPVFGIASFLITLFILYNQAYAKWESSLEKRLSVRYMVSNPDSSDQIPIIEVENAYLAGDADVRQWAMQLGRQIVGDLDLDMNWDNSPPITKYDPKNKSYFRSYTVNLHLSSNPLESESGKQKAEAFLKNKNRFKYSTVENSIDNLPIKWTRA